MKRIATITAIAALGVGALSATASARPCSSECDGAPAAGNEIALAWASYQHSLAPTPATKAKKTAKPKKDTRPLTVVYLGHH